MKYFAPIISSSTLIKSKIILQQRIRDKGKWRMLTLLSHNHYGDEHDLLPAIDVLTAMAQQPRQKKPASRREK
ncbi:hypothetical protein [Dickeya lacustris]|uniref:Uncharacterized protein n=1 Tax=Dickeya lacustris TaxID=2259638 RepID=A0ABY8G2Q2_9GAMM|nr:hypothetical protein [Dickeya lacustris]WFN54210.1 hypothetical protein O1Q98_10895 [Dickeya lacustris]